MASLADLAGKIFKPSGGGLAEMATNTVGFDARYKKYVSDAITKGEEPLSKEEFIKQFS